MIATKIRPAHVAKITLASSLAALCIAPAGFAQSADAAALRRLQEENAALRKQLAEAQGKTAPAAAQPAAAAPAARPAAAPAATSRLATDEGVSALTPFEVKTDKDYGYLKTNAMTATRIGMEIQKVPMNISVISEEFLKDTNARSLTDLFRYSAASSGDPRFAMRVPANEATPQGQFTMRGFQVNTLMRNGVFRYISHNFDNIDRVEVVKGPATVFFGQGYPGGVINFVTKRPSFSPLATEISYSVNNDSGERVNIDHNAVLSKKAAVRFVGGWEDSQGERRFEFQKNITASPSLTLVPFDSGKVKINLELEYSNKEYNKNDYDWIFSDFEGWRKAAAAGPFLSSVIPASAGNGLAANVTQATTTPTLAYSTYINNVRNATGNLMLPAYTSVKRGAYYTDASGKWIYDKAFNYTSRGAKSKELDEIASVTLDASPFEWLDFRYVFTRDHAVHDTIGQGGAITTPYADGIHWNVATGNMSGYWRRTETHNLDLVFKFDALGAKHKVLAGGQRGVWLQQYLGNAAVSDVNWAFLPGATNPIANPDYAGTNTAKYAFGGVPVNQVIRQRDGSIKPVRQIYNNFDPGTEIYPDINQFFQDQRNAVDGYKPTLIGTYVNYQGSFLKDKLTVLAGYRREKRWERGQWQGNNFPWYIYPGEMWLDPVKYPENQWGHSIAYQKTVPLDQKGNSWMAGASYEVTRQLSAYVSVSRIFKFNSGNIGGYFPGDEVYYVNGILAEARARGQNGFTYRGQNITSVDQFLKVIQGLRYDQLIPNETGMNYEVGAKYTSADNKIVGTWSLFSANRANRKEDDGVAQSNLNEPLNYSADPLLIAGVARGIAAGGSTPSGFNSAASTGRIFRVRAYDNNVRIAGTEAEVIYTPIRNFQAVINASFLPTAKLIEDSRPVYAKPGSAGYAALSATQKRDADILWGARVENVPEYRFNVFGKYTFTENLIGGLGRGLAVGVGARYSSETVVSRSVDWNPLAGGYQAGNYMVFDLTLSLPWELMGYKIHSNLGVYNVADKQYSEGSFAMSPARNWLFTNTLRF